MALDSQQMAHNQNHASVSHNSPTPNLKTTSSSTSTHANPSSRRNSTRRRRRSSIMLLSPTSENGDRPSTAISDDTNALMHDHDSDSCDEIAITSTGKAAGKNITPFLSKHIPNTYNPMNKQAEDNAGDSLMENIGNSNTKFCNRHRPDRKCRRQADGPSMDQLQNEISSLSHSDRSAISHVWSVFSAAPSKQRSLILKGILSVACFNQLSFISSQIRDLIKIDFISLLPTEISLQILSKLDMISLCKAAQVCRTWRELADDDEVWHTLCAQHVGSRCRKCGWGLPLLEKQRLREWRRGKANVAHAMEHERADQEAARQHQHGDATPTGSKRSREDDVPQASSRQKRQCTPDRENTTTLARRPWKSVYKDRFIVGNNWRHGRHQLNIIKSHTNGVTCLQEGSNVLGEHILAAGAYDCTATMHNIETGQLLKTFEGATQGIRCLQFNHRQFITGSLDGKVRIYDIESGDLKKTLDGPTKGVLSVHNEGHFLAAGSMDHNIYLWNVKNRRTELLRGHTDFVNSVFVDPPSRTLFSASDDCSVALWDLDTKRILKRFEGHVGPVQQVIPMPAEFEMDAQDLAEIRREYESDAEHGLEGGSGLTPPPSLSDERMFPHDEEGRPNPTPKYIVTAGLDSTLRLWHVSSGRCLRTYFGHLEGIWSCKADNLRIVSTSEDGMVKVWDPHSAKCDFTFTGHTGPVTCCSLSGERLITGGEDCEIRVMTFSENEESKKQDEARRQSTPSQSQ